MKSDRELLELAAKAAEYSLTNGSRGYREFRCRGGVEWNPLSDYGDSLRLAVDLSFDILINPCGTEIFSAELEDCIYQSSDNQDAGSATRRAITRAAAKIGAAMPV